MHIFLKRRTLLRRFKKIFDQFISGQFLIRISDKFFVYNAMTRAGFRRHGFFYKKIKIILISAIPIGLSSSEKSRFCAVMQPFRRRGEPSGRTNISIAKIKLSVIMKIWW